MASVWSVPVHDLVRSPGASRPFAFDVTLPERMGNAVIGIPAGGVVHVAGRIETLHDGLLVTADVDATADGECVRCLLPIAEPVEVDFQELFGYAGASDFDYQLTGDELDLEQVVTDAVVPALPFQPVCQEDCEGLCPECGVRLLENPGHAHDAPVDPRWAALDGLRDGSETKLPE